MKINIYGIINKIEKYGDKEYEIVRCHVILPFD